MKRYGHAIAAVISLLYVIAGWLWIFVSDRSSTLLLKQSPRDWLNFQTYKGFGFVLFSGLLFYILLRTYIVSYWRAKNIYWGLVERSLQGFFIVQDGRVVLTNRAALEMIGYSADQIYALPIWHALKMVCPEDRRGLMQNIRALVQGKITSCTQEICFHARDGRTLWLLILLESITYKGRNAIQFMYLDISDRKTGEQILQRKDRILEAVSFAAEQFLQAATWTETIQSIIERLGQAAEVSRVYIFKKHNSGQQKTLVSQVYAWTASGITSQMDNSALQGLDVAKAGFQRWLDAFEKHLPVYGLVRDFPESERAFLFSQGIKSLLCVPIFAGKNLWGFIRFDDCLNERHWSKSEIDALEIAASIFESAIGRQDSEIATERQVRELIVLHKVSIAQAEANSIDELLKSVTYIIGEVFYTDNLGVLLLEEDGKTLYQHASYCGISPTMAPERFPITEGITGQVARTGKPLRIGDVRTCKDYIETTPEVRSELCVPIKIGERVLGVINAESRELNAFSEDDERLLATIASGLANSIEKIRLFESEQVRRREAEMQSRIATAVSSSLDLTTVLDTILESIKQVIPYDSASIFLSEGKNVRMVACKGFNDADVFLLKKTARKSLLLNKIKKSGQALLIEDLTQLKGFDQWSSGPRIHAWIGVPLIARGEIIGYMTLDGHQPGLFHESHKSFALAVAYQAAIAIQNARSFDVEQRRRQDAETMQQALEMVSSSLDLTQVLNNLLTVLKQAIPYDSATVFLVEKDVVRIMACHSANRAQEQIVGKTFPLSNPLFDEVRQRRTVLILEDTQNDPRFKKWGGTNYVHGWMGVPLIARGEIIGFITVDSRQQAAFDQESARLAQTFAYQAATAIQNARLYQQAVQAAERRSVLHRLSQDINFASTNPEETYASIHKAVRELMACDAFLIALKDDVSGGHELVYLYEGDQRFPSVRLERGQGMTGEVIQKGQTLLVDDVYAEENKNVVRFGSERKVRSILAVPLRIQNKIIGVLSTQSYHRNAYGEEERVLLEMLANHAAVALENSRLFQETRRRLADLEALAQVSKVLSQTLELEPLLQNILQAACRSIPMAEKGSIALLEGHNSLRIYATHGYTDPRVIGTQFEEKGYGILAMKEKRPLLIEDAHAPDVPPYDGQVTEIAAVKSAIIAPMISKEQIIGVLSLDNTSRLAAFNEDDLKLLAAIAGSAALAIENARLFSEIRRRLNELIAINSVSSTLRNVQTLEEMLPALLDETLNALDLQVGSIWLLDQHTGQLNQVEARGWLKQIPKSRLNPGEGIVGHAFATGEVCISDEISTDERVHPENRPLIPPGWGGICVPIGSTGETIGVYLVAVCQPRRLQDDDARLLATFADMAGGAIHRMNLYRNVESQLRRLTALRDVDTAIASSFDLRVTLTILIENAISRLNVDAAAVLLYNPNSQTLSYAFGRGFRTSYITRSILRIGEGLPGRAALNRSLIAEPDLPNSPLFRRRELLAGEDFRCYYAVPLIAKGQVKGVLEIFHRSPLTPTPDWLEFLRTLAGQAAIAIDNTQMFDKLQRSNQELIMAYDTTLEGWSKALELRDRETEGHAQRVTELTLELARRMGVPPADLVHIRRGVLLHDIGKMGIPDQILRKTGPLTKEEWKIMRQHPKLAYDLLAPIAYLRSALDIPYCHHEMWNGKGYPRGLKGEEIPIAARIFSVVDVWDALAFDRPYRSAWPREKIIRYIRSQSGKRFDPMVVDTFLEMIAESKEK